MEPNEDVYPTKLCVLTQCVTVSCRQCLTFELNLPSKQLKRGVALGGRAEGEIAAIGSPGRFKRHNHGQ